MLWPIKTSLLSDIYFIKRPDCIDDCDADDFEDMLFSDSYFFLAGSLALNPCAMWRLQ